MSRTALLDDQMWARIEPLLPSSVGRRSRPFRDHRQVVEGILYRLRTGVPWRDLPADFGPWQTVWKRHYRWSTDGTYAQMFLAVQEAFGLSSSPAGLVQVISVDSTSIRAHQHAAGARKDVLAGGRVTGGGTELHDSAA